MGGLASLCFRLALLVACATPAFADTIRLATFNASLSRNGPGVLLLALQKQKDPQIEAVMQIIRTVRPDILLINEFDFDRDGLALAAFVKWLSKDGYGTDGIGYKHSFTTPPNTGVPSGIDLNGDGKSRSPNDAFGYGTFPGQYGMLLLSRFPIDTLYARSFAQMRWADFTDARLPVHPDGSAFPSVEAHEIMRLSSKSHWDVPVQTPAGVMNIFASHPTPPVFDGPEDANGRRNSDEIAFWSLYLNGTAFTDDSGVSASFSGANPVVMGDLNADPNDGDGIHPTISALLSHPALQDPMPESDGAVQASVMQAGQNKGHKTPDATDTADWNDKNGPGNLRVDYVLPAAGLTVLDSGVFWPRVDAPGHEWIGSGRPVSSDHRLVWVDVTF